MHSKDKKSEKEKEAPLNEKIDNVLKEFLKELVKIGKKL